MAYSSSTLHYCVAIGFACFMAFIIWTELLLSPDYICSWSSQPEGSNSKVIGNGDDSLWMTTLIVSPQY